MARPTARASDVSYQKSHVRDDRRPDIIVSHTICIALALIAVVLRFMSKRMRTMKVGWDDYMILAGLVFALGQVAAGLLGLRYGEARHAILLKDPRTFAKIVIAIEVLYNPAIACVKLSCLLLYRRAFPSHTFHVALYAIGGFIFVYSWVITISVIFQCSPVRAAWDVSVPNAQCIDFNVEAVVFAALNAATDILAVCLPMPMLMLWRLGLPLERRIQLMGVFLVGAL